MFCEFFEDLRDKYRKLVTAVADARKQNANLTQPPEAEQIEMKVFPKNDKKVFCFIYPDEQPAEEPKEPSFRWKPSRPVAIEYEDDIIKNFPGYLRFMTNDYQNLLPIR